MKGRKGAVLELPDDISRWLEIDPAIAPVEITLATQKWGPGTEEDEIVKDWVKKVRGLYYRASRKRSKKVVVGLVADTGLNYRNGEKGKKHGNPIRLLQICVGGGHVLFYYCYTCGVKDRLPQCLVDLLIDNKTTTVAAVGMKKLKERLERYFDLTLPRSTDLSEMAAMYDRCFVKPGGYDNFSVMKLADEVFRDGSNRFDHSKMWDHLSGGKKSMVWWCEGGGEERRSRVLSEEKISTGALEAYLVHQMCEKLLWIKT